MGTTVYLIRHCEQMRKTDFNHFRSNDSGQLFNEKLGLTIKGEKRAQELSELTELQGLDEVWTSNYARAFQTAKYLAFQNNVLLNLDERLKERKVGIPGSKERKDFWLKQYLDMDFKYPEGESLKEVKKRMVEVIEEIKMGKEGKRIAIVSHGTAISCYLLEFLTLKEATPEKKRHFTYQGKTVINDSFSSPEIFKLTFEMDILLGVERITPQEWI